MYTFFNFLPNLVNDLTSHEYGPGFFTLVAGTCVFGSQIITVTGNVPIAIALWFLGIVLWLIVMYTFFTSVTIRFIKPNLAEGINGAWLIAAVATQRSEEHTSELQSRGHLVFRLLLAKKN